PEDQHAYLSFIMRFQQYTGPLMAKGLEDTAFYRYNRLVSLNEVGGDPARFGVPLEAFHRHNQERLAHWPHALLATPPHTPNAAKMSARVLTSYPSSHRSGGPCYADGVRSIRKRRRS